MDISSDEDVRIICFYRNTKIILYTLFFVLFSLIVYVCFFFFFVAIQNHYSEATREKSRPPIKKMRVDSEGRVRSSSTKPRDESGVRDIATRIKVRTMSKKAQKRMNRMAKQGEADRKIPNVKPKHLFTGKRGIGKTAWR